MRGLLRRHRHLAIDFNQGYIARPSAEGIAAAPTQVPYTTAALAVMFRPGVQLTVMNFAHAKVGRRMPTVTFSGEDMLRCFGFAPDQLGDDVAALVAMLGASLALVFLLLRFVVREKR